MLKPKLDICYTPHTDAGSNSVSNVVHHHDSILYSSTEDPKVAACDASSTISSLRDRVSDLEKLTKHICTTFQVLLKLSQVHACTEYHT